MKSPIGILDMGIDNISILNLVQNAFRYEHFLYVNDLECPEYEGLPIDEILNRVKRNVAFLLSKNVKLIIVVSNTILEYCYNYFNEIRVPVINIFDIITTYLNDKYEHKNMALLANENIMNANIYQKKLRYNHLYSIISNKLDEIVVDNKLKTQLSFDQTKEVFKPVITKDVDIIIPTSFNLLLLTTEIAEYMRESEILPLGNLIIDKITAALLAIENLYSKRKGKAEVFINKKSINFNHLINKKIKVLMIDRKD